MFIVPYNKTYFNNNQKIIIIICHTSFVNLHTIIADNWVYR